MTVSHRFDTAAASQPSFDDLEPPLRDTTFVVVDLETTGGSSRMDAITEIGAVKVRGGEVLGEFSTLVDPGRSIPPQIVQLTGITDAMVVDAPREASVVPSFLEFARGSVLVAHNAPFDIGFLKAACERLAISWPADRYWTRSALPARSSRAANCPACVWACWLRRWALG